MGMDYNMLASFMHGVNSDEPLLNEGEVLNKLNNYRNGLPQKGNYILFLL
jgi:hypothetical protein